MDFHNKSVFYLKQTLQLENNMWQIKSRKYMSFVNIVKQEEINRTTHKINDKHQIFIYGNNY